MTGLGTEEHRQRQSSTSPAIAPRPIPTHLAGWQGVLQADAYGDTTFTAMTVKPEL